MGEVSVVDRTQDDAAFDSLANSPTIQTEWTRDSCANIFGNELASIIARRLRVYTRTCSSLAWALSYDIESAFLFSTYSCTRSIFPLSRLRETRRELSALLSFQNPRIKARAMNGRRTYSSLDTTFNSDETDIRIFRFLRFDLTSVLGARSREKEREKRSFVEHRDQVVRESDVVLVPV